MEMLAAELDAFRFAFVVAGIIFVLAIGIIVRSLDRIACEIVKLRIAVQAAADKERNS